MNREQTHPLKFKSYEADPLAVLVLDRLGWRSWQLPLVYVAVFVAATSVAAAFYLFSDTVAFDLTLKMHGGWPGVVSAIAYNVIVLVVVSRLYLYLSEKSGTIYEHLSDSNVIDKDDPAVITAVNGSRDSVRSSYARRWWLLAVAIALLFALLVAYQSGMAPRRDPTTEFRSRWVLSLVPLWGVGAYMVVMAVVSAVATIRGLRKVFRAGKVEVHPLHPDGAGGLRHVRELALTFSYGIAALGVVIVLGTFSVMQLVCLEVESAGSTSPTIECVGESKNTTSDDQILKEGSVRSKIDRLANFYAPWIGIAVYVIGMPLAFFGTLGTAHAPMSATKSDYL